MQRVLSFNSYLLETADGLASGVKEIEDTELINSFCGAIRRMQPEESPRGSNRGEDVESMLTAVNTLPGEPWCAAYIYSILSATGFSPKIKNKIPNTARVLTHWETTGGEKILGDSVEPILPGMIFCYLNNPPSKAGHTGIVLLVNGKVSWRGIEGNTNPVDGDREGYGTFLITRQVSNPSIAKDPNTPKAKLLGFIDYFKPYRDRDPGFTDKLTSELKKVLGEIEPKTKGEIAFLKSNKEWKEEYENNWNNRNKT